MYVFDRGKWLYKYSEGFPRLSHVIKVESCIFPNFPNFPRFFNLPLAPPLLSPQVPFIPPLSCELVRRQDLQPVAQTPTICRGKCPRICVVFLPPRKSHFQAFPDFSHLFRIIPELFRIFPENQTKSPNFLAPLVCVLHPRNQTRPLPPSSHMTSQAHSTHVGESTGRVLFVAILQFFAGFLHIYFPPFCNRKTPGENSVTRPTRRYIKRAIAG